MPVVSQTINALYKILVLSNSGSHTQATYQLTTCPDTHRVATVGVDRGPTPPLLIHNVVELSVLCTNTPYSAPGLGLLLVCTLSGVRMRTSRSTPVRSPHGNDGWMLSRDFGRESGMLDLLNEMRNMKERRDARQANRRGGMLVAAFVLLLLVLWMRSGRTQASGSGGGASDRVVHCFFLLDRTGSMRSLKGAVKSGFDQYVEQQQSQPGSMLLTLAHFSSSLASSGGLSVQFEARDIHAVGTLDSYEPSGATPLYDALANFIEHASKASASAARPTETVVVVFTDGKENASREHSRAEVFQQIEERRKAGWTFVFLGANQDALGTSAKLGLSAGAASNYVADSRGVQFAWSDLSGGVSRARKSLRSGRTQVID